MQHWQNLKSVYCKLSGLVTEAEKGKWTKEMLEPYLDVIFENFGTSRIMFGSDWPVMLLNTNYTEWIQLVKDYIQRFSKEEQQQILRGNAVDFIIYRTWIYNLKIKLSL